MWTAKLGDQIGGSCHSLFDDDNLDQSGSRGGGEEWSHSRERVKVELSG